MANIENQHFDEEPPFSEKEKSLYQAAYKQLQDEIDVSFYNPEKSFAEIERKLGFSHKGKQEIKGKQWFLGGVFTTGRGVFATPAYAIASVVLIAGLGATTVWQTSRLNQANTTAVDVLRGQAAEQISLIVEDPNKTALAIEEELLKARVENFISYKTPNKVIIRIPVNENTINLMAGRRIELPQSKYCDLVIEKK